MSGLAGQDASPDLSRRFLCLVGPGPGQKSAGRAGPGQIFAGLSRPVPFQSLVLPPTVWAILTPHL